MSVPKQGEVWWRDARHQQERWGLPGAGFAARGHPDADTDGQPLAVAEGRAGERAIELEGERLTRYVDGQLDEEQPLLFLLKLADGQEDEIGSLLEILSAEYGDDTNPSLRPRLRIEWTPPPTAVCHHEDVFLEHGRNRELPPFESAQGGAYWVSFSTEEGFEPSTIQWRVGGGEDSQDPTWRSAHQMIDVGDVPLQLRVVAARNPIPLGSVFHAKFEETWVVTAPPEDQELRWRFTSPTGVTHETGAEYQGGFTWEVSFRPDEIGRWRMQWRHRFWGEPEVGPEGIFDVVATGLAEVCRQLDALAEAARVENRGGDVRQRELERLYHLERAGMQQLTPREFRSGPGERFRGAMHRAREAIMERSLPKTTPMESHALRHGVDGRRFREPIPRNSAFRAADSELSGPGLRIVRRIRAWGGRALKELAEVLFESGTRRDRGERASSPQDEA